ncbi:bactofilin family protein [Allosphingosinicella sp.]|jgi:cytoskeletal protein CcmA (bactofilin family)|uniref:bactofilin family protein n=1 Tax=Allosphingosinicella sp. TaxID=2823234 RepID=UPI002EE25FBE
MFGKSGKENGPERPRRGGGVVSVIGGDAVISGDIEAADGLKIDGRIQGDVRCGSLDQGAEGTIAGNIVADEARLAGLVDGTVSVKTLVLEASARITGDVTYETLTIASGARVEGRFAHRDSGAGLTPGEQRKKASGATDVSELFSQAAE